MSASRVIRYEKTAVKIGAEFAISDARAAVVYLVEISTSTPSPTMPTAASRIRNGMSRRHSRRSVAIASRFASAGDSASAAIRKRIAEAVKPSGSPVPELKSHRPTG